MIYILALFNGVLFVGILLMARESKALKAAQEQEAQRELEAALEAQRERENVLPYRREAEAPDEAVEDAGPPEPLRGLSPAMAAALALMFASAYLRRKK